MSEELYHVIYRSVAAETFSPSDLVPLLSQARTFNNERQITGVLLMRDGAFFQYIEGEKSAVLSLLESIRNDSRHHSLELVSEGSIVKRAFDRWSMAFEHLSMSFESTDPEVDVFVRSPGWRTAFEAAQGAHIEAIQTFLA